MHIHHLDGCAPTPLAHYLKALGILRLVAQQADPAARGWWDGESFRLATILDRDDLESFFLLRYEPTPLVAPWNKGSGFFQANDPGIAPIESSTAKRLWQFRDGIAASRVLLAELTEADAKVRSIKAETKTKGISKSEREALRRLDAFKKRLAEAERRFKTLKADLIPRLRTSWRGPHRDWMDAAMVVDDSQAARFPALLGTGGNDGRLDFTNNFMQRLGEIFDLASSDASPRMGAAPWLVAALWATPVTGYVQDRAVGQFLPGAAGGANSLNGPEGTSMLNPFDFILMMEGCLLLTANTTKRLDANSASRAAAPFVVAPQAAGYPSASGSDESARGEQWMPLWGQPMTLPETKHLFAEGRAQIGHASAKQPIDMARAAAGLGVARGITAFERFGYIERNGQSNLAVPLGRFYVRGETTPHVDCLDDVAPWLSKVGRIAVDDETAARFASTARRLGDAAFDVTQRAQEPARWQTLLLALTGVEATMRIGTGFQAQPVPPLRPEWVVAADDGSPEFHLALSFALQARAFRRDDGRPIDSIRRHWLPLADTRRRPRFATTGDGMRPRLDRRLDVVMNGRSGIDDAIALCERRIVEAARDGLRGFPLQAAPRAAASIADLCAWIEGRVDTDRTLALARALMALDRGLWAEQFIALVPSPSRPAPLDDAWACIRLVHSPWRLPDGRELPCDPAILRRLAAGDASTAVELALRRLGAAGMRTNVRAASASDCTARLWASALAFPISRQTATRLAHQLDPLLAQEQTA